MALIANTLILTAGVFYSMCWSPIQLQSSEIKQKEILGALNKSEFKNWQYRSVTSLQLGTPCALSKRKQLSPQMIKLSWLYHSIIIFFS